MDEENVLRSDIQNLLIINSKAFLPNDEIDEAFTYARNAVMRTTKKGAADFVCKAFVSIFLTLKRNALEEGEEENEVDIRKSLSGLRNHSYPAENKLKQQNSHVCYRRIMNINKSINKEKEKKKEKSNANGDEEIVIVVIYRVSEYGLIQRREYKNAFELCDAVYEHMDTQEMNKIGIADIRTCRKTGTMKILTKRRLAEHAKMGELMCSMCGRFFEASKGLVSHSISVHKNSYEEGKYLQQTARNSLIDLTNIDALQREYLLNRFKEVCINEETKKKKSVAVMLHPFLEICKTGSIKKARKYIRENPDVDIQSIRDVHGSNCLHWSAGSNMLELCKFLCDELGINPSYAERKKGRAAIHWASRNGCTKIIKWLVENKSIDKDCEMSDGTTPFMRACWMGHLETCEYLVREAKCDVHRENRYRCNAVHWAAQSGDVSMLKYLRSLELDFTSENINGHSILHKSATKGFYDACVYLVEELNLPSTRDNDGYSPDDMARIEGYDELAKWLQDKQHEKEIGGGGGGGGYYCAA